MDTMLAVARSVPEALESLARLGPEAVPVAGATWLMREPHRDARLPGPMVALHRIAELYEIEETETDISLGALIDHHRLAVHFQGRAAFAALARAAGQSANPGVRRLATLGGNLCTCEFAAADLPPALLVLGAEVELQNSQGVHRLPLSDFLASRAARRKPEILTRVIVPKASGRSHHVRLPLRKAGDYPVAILSVFARTDVSGTLSALRIAVGSVEPVACRWRTLEEAATGRPLDAPALRALAQEHLSAFTPRDGIDAPGRYRLQVLPALVERAFSALAGLQEG